MLCFKGIDLALWFKYIFVVGSIETPRQCMSLSKLTSRNFVNILMGFPLFQGDDVSGLDINTLEELQNFHIEAITKICHSKVRYIS